MKGGRERGGGKEGGGRERETAAADSQFFLLAGVEKEVGRISEWRRLLYAVLRTVILKPYY